MMTTLGAKIDRDVNVRITVDYLTFADKEPPPGLRKLYQVSLPMTQDAVAQEGEVHHHPTMDETVEARDIVEGMDQHGVDAPGPLLTKKRFSKFIAADATVHFAAVHMYNHGRYMRLTDVTTGEVL